MARRKHSLGFWIVLALLVLDAIAVAVFFAIDVGPKRASFDVERLAPGTEAPDVRFARADGTPVRLASMKGRPVVLHFWATWCAPCREELPVLMSAVREAARQGGPTLLAVSLDDDWGRIRAFFDEETPAEVFRDETASQAFRVEGLPATYFIAADGMIAARILGPRDWASKAARSELERLGGLATEMRPAAAP